MTNLIDNLITSTFNGEVVWKTADKDSMYISKINGKFYMGMKWFCDDYFEQYRVVFGWEQSYPFILDRIETKYFLIALIVPSEVRVYKETNTGRLALLKEKLWSTTDQEIIDFYMGALKR